MILIIELIFVLVCLAAAFIEQAWFKANRSFKHWWGVAIYLTLVGVCFLVTKNIILCLAAILIGEVVFSPVLNLIRGHDFFYTNLDDPKGSKVDKLEGSLNKPIYFLCLGALITLQIIFFK